MIYAFRDCELDEELFQLRRRGKVVKLEPRAFDVLLHLLHHRERVVSKTELLDGVWQGAAVSESVLPSCVAAVRRAVGDDRRGAVIATVHGRGYRFAAAVARSPGGPRADGDLVPLPAPAADTPFVGRDPAIQSLRAGLASALSGHGRLLLLVGEPGIGKTRTAQEFGAQARRRGALVYSARCHEGGGAPAFWPWVRLLRACIEDADAATLPHDLGPGVAEIANLAPELRERLGDVPEAPPLGNEQARFRLFESVTRFLLALARRKPLVLMLDDLHWADDASLQLLRFATGEIAHAPVLLIGAYRDVEVHRGNPLATVLGALAREPVCERIALRGLPARDVALLVEGVGGRPPSARMLSSVCEMTEGNPFFVQEVVRLLADGPAENWDEAGSSPLALPQSVRDAIGRRLDSLSSECNRVLRVASVLGRDFASGQLSRVSGVERDRLLDALGEAVSAHVLAESPENPGVYVFGHALIRQTLYDELDNAERVRLHLRTAEALEEACGAHPEPHLAELAHHFFLASAGGDPKRAVHYCTRAAERAQRLLAYEEAARQYGRAVHALELCVPRDETRRCELLLECGDAHATAAGPPVARDAYRAAAEIARALSRPDLLARAALGYRGGEMGAPVADDILALVEEALLAIGDDHPALRARLLGRRIGTPPHSLSMATRAELSREARAMARDTGDREALRDVLLASRWACLGPDRIGERRTLAAEMFDLAQEIDDKSLAAAGHDVLMGAHMLQGEISAAYDALDTYTQIASELRQPLFEWQASVWRGSRAAAMGDFDEAETLIREARERGRGTVDYANFVYAGQMYFVRLARGDRDDVEESPIFFGEMIESPYSWAPAIRATLAQVWAEQGETPRAQRELDELAVDEFASIPRDEHWLPTIGSFGGLAMVLEDRARAEQLRELLAPYADLVMVHDLLRVPMASVGTMLAGLDTVLGRFDAAAVQFERALARETGMGLVLAPHSTRASYAHMLLRRGATGDARRARLLMDEAIAGWRRCGIRNAPRSGRRYPELASRMAEKLQ